jgi:hypothetical protein
MRDAKGILSLIVGAAVWSEPGDIVQHLAVHSVFVERLACLVADLGCAIRF